MVGRCVQECLVKGQIKRVGLLRADVNADLFNKERTSWWENLNARSPNDTNCTPLSRYFFLYISSRQTEKTIEVLLRDGRSLYLGGNPHHSLW